MMDRYRYPICWEQLAWEAKERADWKCALCGVAHGTLLSSWRTGNPYIVYLQAAHVNHDQDSPDPVLLAVCPTCHGRFLRRKRSRVMVVMCPRRRALRKHFHELNKEPAPHVCRHEADSLGSEKTTAQSCLSPHPHSTKGCTHKQTQGGTPS